MVVSRTVPLLASLVAAMLLTIRIAVVAMLEPAQATFPGKIAFESGVWGNSYYRPGRGTHPGDDVGVHHSRQLSEPALWAALLVSWTALWLALVGAGSV